MNLSFLRPLYERSGPWVSVYLDASRDTERGPKEFGLRWRAARELVESDSDPATLDALERALTDHPTRPGRYGLAAFATAGEVGLVEALPEPPRKENAAVGPLPHAMPLVTQRGERIGWLRVVVDRTGADLIGATEGGLARTRRVKGSGDYPIRKAQPGGWSQPRYQRAAENTWEHNAKEIAEAVSEMAEATGAEVLVVAGDPHARSLLLEHLPERWADRVVETDIGSRAAGADPEPLDDLTARAVVEKAAARTAEVLDRYRTQLGHDAAAGAGLGAVVAALQRAQVDCLLLVDDPSSTAQLWIGPEPTQLAMTADELRAMAVEQPQRVRADAALVRALVGTGAELVLVDEGEIDGGVAAVLRYADAVTRHR